MPAASATSRRRTAAMPLRATTSLAAATSSWRRRAWSLGRGIRRTLLDRSRREGVFLELNSVKGTAMRTLTVAALQTAPLEHDLEGTWERFAAAVENVREL